MKKDTKELGKYLKSLRKEKGKSVEEMAEALKITVINIMNIESGNFDAIGLPDIFIKAYVKSYIMELGESPENVFSKFYNFESDKKIKKKNELNSSTIFYNLAAQISAVVFFAITAYFFVSHTVKNDIGDIDLTKIKTANSTIERKKDERGMFSKDYESTYKNYSETPR